MIGRTAPVLAVCAALAAAGVAAAQTLPAADEPASTDPASTDPAAAPVSKRIVLRGLDKITARISRIEIRIGETVQFGTLRIIAHACDKRPPEEPPETSAFLEITERRPGEDIATPLFTGWMFASSPALSALEHPVYDVWVIDCSASAPDRESPRP